MFQRRVTEITPSVVIWQQCHPRRRARQCQTFLCTPHPARFAFSTRTRRRGSGGGAPIAAPPAALCGDFGPAAAAVSLPGQARVCRAWRAAPGAARCRPSPQPVRAPRAPRRPLCLDLPSRPPRPGGCLALPTGPALPRAARLRGGDSVLGRMRPGARRGWGWAWGWHLA